MVEHELDERAGDKDGEKKLQSTDRSPLSKLNGQKKNPDCKSCVKDLFKYNLIIITLPTFLM